MADAWTDAEKSSLLLQIIAQVKPEKGGINWDLIHIEGRTKKACQNTWHKFISTQKAQQEGLGGEGSSPAKPKRSPVARKRKSKKEHDKVENSDTEDAATPAKKSCGRPRKTKLEYDINVPQPETLKDAKQITASAEVVKFEREDWI
ncbi:hypothetical protein VUR80DRAFT_9561 [Thermomyces stellatus]